MMRTNHVRTKLLAGKPTLGTWMTLSSATSARVLARAGFDWLTVDMEHSFQSPESMAQMVAVIAESHMCAPFVRVPVNSVEWFKWALDAGAWGVIVPMVNSHAEAEQAVSWAKYPPQGTRSIGGAIAPYSFGAATWQEYANAANDEIMVILQIESAAGLAHLDDILSVPGVDVAFVGPNDLHAQLGLAARSESDEPAFLSALDQIKTAARRYNIPLGIYSSDGGVAAERIREGFQMISIENDLSILAKAATQQIELARE
ncbi:MAG: aldolase/citrate lyase family protein [Chloroflexales bacterium]|nr:aldolase/citrate lyase family protein [Chloroflexales bacterium]